MSEKTDVVYIIKSSPYSGENVFAAFSSILAGLDEGIETKLIFMHDGVYNLLTNQDGTSLSNYPTIADIYKSAITEISFFAYKESLRKRDLEEKRLLPGVKMINISEFMSILSNFGKNILIF